MISDTKQYQYLIQYLTDYIYTVRIENKVAVETQHGPGCLAVTGYTSADYEKDPELWYRMVHPDDREQVTWQAQQAFDGRDVKPLEHRIIHRDGSVRWVKNSIVLAKDEEKHLDGYYGLINDITELKKAERLTEIKQRQLLQADKMASLGILVSGIAHEINNPNNFILLNIRLFSKIWTDILPILENYFQENGDFALAGMPYNTSIDKIDASIQGILSGSQRIKEIVQSLTNYARQDTGLRDQAVHIDIVVQNALTIVSNLVKKSTDYLTVMIGDDLPALRGNSQQLEQVIINLITNACQSLEKKSQAISLNGYFDRRENVVIFEVLDQGVGIPEEDLRHIFDPFFTTKRNMGGTGLGLSISYNIIKSHGGELVLESQPGEGTRALIRLPVMSGQ